MKASKSQQNRNNSVHSLVGAKKVLISMTSNDIFIGVLPSVLVIKVKHFAFCSKLLLTVNYNLPITSWFSISGSLPSSSLSSKYHRI